MRNKNRETVMTLKLEKKLHDEFKILCKKYHRSMSGMIRFLMQEEILSHEIDGRNKS